MKQISMITAVFAVFAILLTSGCLNLDEEKESKETIPTYSAMGLHDIAKFRSSRPGVFFKDSKTYEVNQDKDDGNQSVDQRRYGCGYDYYVEIKLNHSGQFKVRVPLAVDKNNMTEVLY